MSDDKTLLSRRNALKCMAYGGAGTLFALSGGVFTPIDLAMAADSEDGAAKLGRPLVRADQRYAYRLQQGSQSRRQRNAERNHRARERHAAAAGAHHSHRRHHASVQARRNSTRRSSCSRACEPPKCIRFPASTTRPTRPSPNISIDSARLPATRATTVSITPACTLSALVNVLQFKPGGLGNLGAEQLAWVASDLKGRSASTPIVVFAHMPLWTIYEPWGWGTGDADQLLESAAPIRLGHGLEWPHPSDRAESRRQHHVPHRPLDRLSAAGGRRRARTRAAEGTGGPTIENARHYQRLGRQASGGPVPQGHDASQEGHELRHRCRAAAAWGTCGVRSSTRQSK